MAFQMLPSLASHAVPLALWVVPVAGLGGVARHVLDVAGAGIPGYRLVVLCPEGLLAQNLRARGCAVMTGRLGPEAGLRNSVREVRSVVRTMLAEVVHSHLSHADLVCALATARLPCALVTTEHGIADDPHLYQSSLVRAHAMTAVHTVRLRLADAAIAVSESTAAVMQRRWHADQRVHVIRNGVDRPLVPPIRRSVATGIHVVSLSRLAPEKGLHELLAVVDELRRLDPAVRLTLAGDGELREALAQEVRRRNLVDHVIMPGHINAHELLSSADVLVQLSRWENASYSILDAAAHGLGVVATPVGGNPEILPPRCLTSGNDHVGAARVVVEQAADLAARPSLPVEWPTVDDTCAQIRDVYDSVRPR